MTQLWDHLRSFSKKIFLGERRTLNKRDLNAQF